MAIRSAEYATGTFTGETLMKIWERRLICGGLGVAGALFLFAAIKPTFAGSSLNATFLILGLVLLIGSIVAWRRFGKSPHPVRD